MGSFWNLPEEITFDILSRLPAKSVGVCRCVWKPWRALLSQPQFIKAHLERSRNTQQRSLTFYHDNSVLCSASMSNAHQMFDKITLSQIKPIVAADGTYGFGDCCSCDGLLLAMIGCFCFVLNPVTREIVELSEVDSPFSRQTVNDYIVETFGYDPVDDDYKVIAVSVYVSLPDIYGHESTPEYDEMLVDVYSLKRGCWKRAQTSVYYDSYVDMEGYPVFLHGHLIWLAKRTADESYAIVAFNLADEKFFEVPPPCSIDNSCCLCVLDGCLCLFHRNAGVDLWMMKEYGVVQSWTKFTINHPKAEMVWDLFWLGEENVVIRYNDNVSVMYNLKEGSFKYFEFPGSGRHVDIRNSFVESLVSPCGW